MVSQRCQSACHIWEEGGVVRVRGEKGESARHAAFLIAYAAVGRGEGVASQEEVSSFHTQLWAWVGVWLGRTL
jgi:hypothetical protein